MKCQWMNSFLDETNGCDMKVRDARHVQAKSQGKAKSKFQSRKLCVALS